MLASFVNIRSDAVSGQNAGSFSSGLHDARIRIRIVIIRCFIDLFVRIVLLCIDYFFNDSEWLI